MQSQSHEVSTLASRTKSALSEVDKAISVIIFAGFSHHSDITCSSRSSERLQKTDRLYSKYTSV